MTSRTPFDSAPTGRTDTIVSRFLDQAARDPERNVFTSYPMGAFNALGTTTWGAWATRSRGVAGALLAMHVRPGARVAILAANCEVWPVAAMGTAMVGAVIVPLSPGASTNELASQLARTKPAAVIVDTIARFRRLRAVQTELQMPFVIICEDLEPLQTSQAAGLFEWESWMASGSRALDDYASLVRELDARLNAIGPSDVIQMHYTSDAESAVTYSHSAMVVAAQSLSESLAITHTDRLAVAQSFSGPFELLLGVYAIVCTGAKGALVEREDDALRAARHHESTIVVISDVMLGDVWSALANHVDNHATGAAGFRGQLGSACRMIATCSKGLPDEIQNQLATEGVSLVNVYGVPEQLCVCQNGPAVWCQNSVGRPCAGVETRLGQWNELQFRRGPTTSLDVDAASAERDWIRTGHIFETLADGALRFVREIDRVLELPGGAFAVAHDVEALLCTLPFVAHAICDSASGGPLVAVLSLNRSTVERWARERGLSVPWEALVEHPLVYDELARGIAGINRMRQVGERVEAFAATDLEFTANTGELDSRGRLNRPVVHGRFEHVLADLRLRSQS